MEQHVFSAASTATEQPHTAHPCDGEGPGKGGQKIVCSPHTGRKSATVGAPLSRSKNQSEKLVKHCFVERTLDLAETPDRPHCRTALVTLELARYNIDIAALSETRLHREDSLTEAGAGYTFFWKGGPRRLSS